MSLKKALQPLLPASSVTPSQLSSLPLQVSLTARGASHALRPLLEQTRDPLQVPMLFTFLQDVLALSAIDRGEQSQKPAVGRHWLLVQAKPLGQSSPVVQTPPQKLPSLPREMHLAPLLIALHWLSTSQGRQRAVSLGRQAKTVSFPGKDAHANPCGQQVTQLREQILPLAVSTQKPESQSSAFSQANPG